MIGLETILVSLVVMKVGKVLPRMLVMWLDTYEVLVIVDG